MDAKEYIAAFDEVKADFEKSVAEFGLPFEAKEMQLRETRVCVTEQCGCHCENGNASLWRNWISPACVACRTGERTATFFTSLKCSRHCYFCFNPNQEDYEYWLSHKRDIAGELREAHAAGAGFDCLAITGGEPLLFKSDVYAFLDAARELYPQAHVRLYTCGDFLDDACLAELRDRGLDEIRFSVKLDGDEALAPEHARTLDAIERAVAFIPDVMVEMPVGPHDELAMKELLVRLDAMGVRGVNLLEFRLSAVQCRGVCRARLGASSKPVSHSVQLLVCGWAAHCGQRGGMPGAYAVCGRAWPAPGSALLLA